MRYAVVLTAPPAAGPGALAQALAPVSGRPAADLAGPLKRAWGLVELDADEAAAKATAAALSAAGAPAMALPSSLLEDLPAAEPVKALEQVRSYALLCAAVFRQVKTKVVAGDLPRSGKRALKTVVEGDLVHYLDLYPGDGRRLRLRADDFDYSCLGQRKGYDAPGNFKRLLETLGPKAKALNSGARGLLDGKPVRELGYEGLDDLDREGRWLLTLTAIGKV